MGGSPAPAARLRRAQKRQRSGHHHWRVRMTSYRSAALLLLGALSVAPARASAQMQRAAAPAAPAAELPLKHAATPTTAAITPADLMTRLYIYADDSLMGREVGT